MRVKRAIQGAAAAALLLTLLPATSAQAASGVAISSIVTNSGTFTTSPSAGKINNPTVAVTNVVAGENVVLSWTGPHTGSANCVVAPGATSVRFNDVTNSNCVVPASSIFQLNNTGQASPNGTYTFVATTGPNVSAEFLYIKESLPPAAPAAPLTVTKKPAAAIEVSFGISPGDDGTSGQNSGLAKYEILRENQTDSVAFAVVKTLLVSECTTTCTWLDSGPGGGPEDGKTYRYAARAVDKAGNQSPPPSPAPQNPVSDPVTADGTPPTTPAAPTVTSDDVNSLAGYGTDASPVISVTNPASEAVSIQLVLDGAIIGIPKAAGAGATVTWNSSTVEIGLGEDKTYQFAAQSSDSVGNPTISASTSYVLDRVAPSAPTITSVNDQSGSTTAGSDTSPKVVVGSIANGDRVTLTVDDNDTTPPAGSFNKTSTGTSVTFNPTAGPDDFTITGGDRSVSISATTRDQAGNLSSSSATTTYTVDSTPPDAPSIVSVDGDTTSPGEGYDRTPPIVVSWAATTHKIEIYSGATKVGEKLVGATTSPLTLNAAAGDSDVVLGFGTHTLKARALDLAGNGADSATFTFEELDNRTPDVPSALTATQISGSPGRISLDWADASDQDDASGNSSPPVKYDITRAQADPVDSSCPAAGSQTYTALASGVASSDYIDAATTAGKCHYYKVRSVDGASNESAYSSPTSGIEVASTRNPAQPTITSVNGDTSSPATGSGSASAKPSVIVSVGEVGGTVTLYVDGTAAATKTVSGTSITIAGADWTGSVPVREHDLTVIHRVNSLTSPTSSAFRYGRQPAAPTITQVAGKTTSPAKSSDRKPAVNVSGVQSGDEVKLYDGANLLATKTASGTTISFTFTDYPSELALGNHPFTVTTCDSGVGSCSSEPNATSPASAVFTYQRTPVVKGYELDGFGGLHPVGGAPKATGGPYWSGWDIARAVALRSNGTSGYVLDGYGGIHAFGGAPAVAGSPYFGFDIARDLILVSDSSGYVLDGFGGIHPFGGAPAMTGGPYFLGFDIARALVSTSSGKGYVLDGWGGTHRVGGAPALSGTPYFAGNDIARDLVLRANKTSGYVLDGVGGTHAFGGAPGAPTTYYSPSSPNARKMVLTEVDGDGGYIVDARGGLHVYGTAASLPRPVTFPFDIARDVAVTLS